MSWIVIGQKLWQERLNLEAKKSPRESRSTLVKNPVTEYQ